MGKKKLQIFISSTYTDLQEERQAAVEAILGSKHIPAGMELFKAGNMSQLETIKKWINESDLYMLILGGRYGSIEMETGKSYTHLEYEYALENQIPVFSVVLDDSFLHKKAAQSSYVVFEEANPEKYNEFKKIVTNKVVKFVNDCKDIQIAIKDSISDLEEEYDLVGWVRASEIEDLTAILQDNCNLLKENDKLKNHLQQLKEKEKDKIGEYSFETLKQVLSRTKIKIPGEYLGKKEDLDTDYLIFLESIRSRLITGIHNSSGMEKSDNYIFFQAAPFLVQFGLVEINKVPGVQYRRLEITKQGLKFFAWLELNN